MNKIKILLYTVFILSFLASNITAQEISDSIKGGANANETLGLPIDRASQAIGNSRYILDLPEVLPTTPEGKVLQVDSVTVINGTRVLDMSFVDLLESQDPDTTLIYRQEVSAGNFFTDLLDLTYENESSISPNLETKYSILGDLESYRSNGKFTFILIYKDLNISGEITATWSQSSNFMTGTANTVDGFELISNSVVDNSFGGLSINNNTGATTLIQGNQNVSNWWWSIGAKSIWPGAGAKGVPAALSPVQVSSGLIELYAISQIENEAINAVSDSINNIIVEDSNGKAYLSEDKIPTYNPASFSKEEIWLKIGQSNSVGTDGSGPIDHYGLDAPNPKVFEYSRGSSKTNIYRAAPAGELMTYKNPAQDDSNGIGYGLSFGKQRVTLNPNIEKLIIINRGVGGTGFNGNRWNPGDDLYNLAVTDLKNALQNNPDAIFRGIIWHQGESDAGQTQQWYEDRLLAMVEGIRNEAKSVAPGRVIDVFICGTMVESWIASNEATRRPIDIAHRNVSNYIENSDYADFSELTDFQDAIHFGTSSLREMGRIYADVAQKINIEQFPSYHLKVQGGNQIDLFENGGLIYNPTISNDLIRGDVFDSQNTGFQTSMILNNTEYTKSGWLNIKTTVSGYGNFISGSIATGVANAHYWGWSGSGQGGSTTAATTTGINGNATIGNWVHLTITWDGSEHKLYVNGSFVSSIPITNNITPPQIIELCTFGGNGQNQLNALFDDIIILPYALTDIGVNNLFNYVN